MADEQTPPEIPTEKAKTHVPIPSWARYVILTAAFLLLLVLVQWAGGMHAETVRRETFAKSVDALSGSLAQALVDRNVSRLQSTVQRIADASGYDKVTITDEAGVVQASTDRTLDGKNLETLKNAPLKTSVRVKDGHLTGSRAIILAGDTRLGGIEVVASF